MNRQTLKDNAALVAGIVLPLLLVLVVWGSQKIVEMAVPDPAYSLVYVKFNDYMNRNNVIVQPKDNRIVITPFKRDEHLSSYQGRVDLIVVNPATGERKVEQVIVPEYKDENQPQSFPVPEPFASMTVLQPDKAPDGYEVQNRAYYNGGIVRELLDGRHRSNLVISKYGRNIIVDTQEPYFNNIHILGWVKP